MALITINGKEIRAEDGALILDVAREAGFEIPTFCYHAKLSKLGSCRMCLVEIEGMRKLQPSCVTPVMDGMKVFTESPSVVKARKAQLEFLLINHPLDCPVCDQAGECDLQDLTFKFGSNEGRYRWRKRTFPKRDMGQAIVKEMNRCIACRRCSRYCSEVSGDFAISELNRGNELEMGTFCHTPVDSEFIGNTAQLCPVGALTNKHFRFKARVWDLRRTETICPHCSVGCSITSESKYVSQKATQMLHTQNVGRTPALEETEVKVLRNSATEDKGVTDISICDRGRYGHHFINSDARLTAPMVREGDRLVETSWDNALAVVASRLANIKERNGADAIGGVTSGICSNEDGYIFQKFMRKVMGTNNVDMVRGGTVDRAAALRLAAMRGDLAGIRSADRILVLGSSVGTDTPIASMNAGIAARMNGAVLITLTAGEDRLVTSKPKNFGYLRGRERQLVTALTKAVIDANLYPNPFREKRKKELDAVAEPLNSLNLDDAEGMCGVSREDIEFVVTELAKAEKGVILFGDDMLSCAAPEMVQALYNLASLLGFTGERGRIMYAPACGNTIGNLDVGVAPDYLPGYIEVGSVDASEGFKLLWGTPPPENQGLGWSAMLDAASGGSLKGLYVMGDDPVGTSPNRQAVRDALGKLDFLVVQDLFMTETAKMADVVLPAVSYAEKSGTVTNMEGRVQKLALSIRPVGGARSDWRILCDLAAKMGGRMEYGSVEEITDEISRAVGHYGGAAAGEIDRDGFMTGGPDLEQAPLIPVDPGEGEPVKESGDYPFYVVPGRDVFTGGSLTWMDEGLMKLSYGGRILLSGADAEDLDVANGDRVTVETENGSLDGEVKITERVRAGVVVVPVNHPVLDPWMLFAGREAVARGRLKRGT